MCKHCRSDRVLPVEPVDLPEPREPDLVLIPRKALSQRIPTVEAALASPFDYEVRFNVVGWILTADYSPDISTFISEEDAAKVIAAIKVARNS